MDLTQYRGFYGIVDPEHCPAGAVETADALLAGGCSVLQLRDKRGNDRDTLELARALRARCAPLGIPFVMNDRLDLALLVEADGLHLGQDDLPLEAVRPHFSGPIGLSTHSLEQALASKADLIGFGPVFSTQTKDNPDPVVGIDGLREVVRQVDVPVVAIGGIDRDGAKQAFEAGASMVAAISAVSRAGQMQDAAQAFVAAYKEASQ